MSFSAFLYIFDTSTKLKMLILQLSSLTETFVKLSLHISYVFQFMFCDSFFLVVPVFFEHIWQREISTVAFNCREL